jgi:hypothetical protein
MVELRLHSGLIPELWSPGVTMTNEEKRRMYTALAAPFLEHCIFDLQPTGYKLAARQAGMGDVGLRLQVVTKSRTPVVQVADVERGPRDEDDFLRTAGGVRKAIDVEVSYPIRGW